MSTTPDSQPVQTNLNKIGEAVFVLSLGFGLFIYSSTYAAFFEDPKAGIPQTYNSYDFAFIVLYELIALSIIAGFLKRRNWTLKDFNLDFAPYMAGIALLLAITRITSGLVIHRALALANISNLSDSQIHLQPNLLSITFIVIINSFFEEVLLIGYLFKRFESAHPAFLILTSLIVRASFHTYQGWENLLSVFAMAAIFGLYYTKYKKLWPVILAHAIGNTFYFLDM